MTARAPLAPGRVSPPRPVPEHIPRPEYVGRRGPTLSGESLVKDAATVERIRRAGRLAAEALAEVGRWVRPGVATDELDQVGHNYLCAHGAYPSTLGYRGYPKSLCTSANEVVCHGIPDTTRLAGGDIVNVDVTAYLDGVHGDTNATFLVGEVVEPVRLLVSRTREATLAGIRAILPGRPVNVIGLAVESYAWRFGYGVARDFTGHGIGRDFHDGVVVPHFFDPRRNMILEPGMTFTVEPILTLGDGEAEFWPDGWTAVTRDRRWTAQFEHTVVVTDVGADILTPVPVP